MTKKILCSVLLLFGFELFAQENDELIRRRMVIGISSGIESTQSKALYYRTDYAYYLLSAHNGAIDRGQYSLISNHSYHYLWGMQIALMTNSIGHNKIKMQREDPTIFQGLQLAALINKVDGKGVGAQLAAFNIVKSNFTGVQLGVINSTKGFFNGFSFGILNKARGYSGLQLGILKNHSSFQSMGFQIAPFNFAQTAGYSQKRSLDHFQFGLINRTKINYGLQIGIINICKDNKGIPIGIINTGTNYGFLSLTADELINTQLMLGTGSKYLNNRLSLGYNYAYNTSVDWSVSYGLEFHYDIYQGPTHAIFSDLILLRLREANWREGLLVNRIGYIYADDFFRNVPPIALGVNMNIGFFDKNSAGLNLPYIASNQSISIWPGLIIGFRV